MDRGKLCGVLAMIGAMASLSAAWGQGTDLKTIFSDPNVPMSMKLKDLSHDWRRFKLATQMDLSSIIAALSEMTTPAGGILYTRGDTVTASTETYLITYQVPTKAIDLTAMMSGYGRKPAPPKPLTPDTGLVLSLLNLRTVGSLTEMQPFDLQRELAASQEQDETAARAEAAKIEMGATTSLGELNSEQLQYRIKHHHFGTISALSAEGGMSQYFGRATTLATAQEGYYYTIRLDTIHPGGGYFAVATPVKSKYARVLYTDEVGVVYAALKPTEPITSDHNGKAPGPNWTVAGS